MTSRVPSISSFATRLGAISAMLACLAGVGITRMALAAPSADSTLTVNKSGNGGGVVISTGTINCGGACSESLPDGTMVTLTAAPAAGSQFTGWLGPCTGSAVCQFTLSGNTTAE